jgi:hypothetical protein
MRPPDAAPQRRTAKTVRLYGETLQRSHGGFVGRSKQLFGAHD